MDLHAGSCQFYRMKTIVLTVQLALLIGAVLPHAALAQQSVTDYEYGLCNTATFSHNDSFAGNLYAVANSLEYYSSRAMYFLALSETGSQSNYVYGMYQCRGDISLADCSTCVTKGLTTMTNVSFCGNLAKGSRVQFKGCYLRYENYIFYNGVEKDGIYVGSLTCTGSSNESTSLYQHNVGTALENSATAAPKHGLFGYNASSVGSGSNTAYALTQCLGYLNSSQCAACLSQVSNYSSACNRSVSGHVYFNDCYYLFDNTSLLFTYDNPPPSVNSADAPSSSQSPAIAIPLPEKRAKNHTPAIVGIVVGVCLLLATVTALALCLLKGRKKAENSAKSQDLLLDADKQLLTHEGGARRFSLKELNDATNDFHPDYKLGEGGFGPVYQVKTMVRMVKVDPGRPFGAPAALPKEEEK